MPPVAGAEGGVSVDMGFTGALGGVGFVGFCASAPASAPSAIKAVRADSVRDIWGMHGSFR